MSPNSLSKPLARMGYRHSSARIAIVHPWYTVLGGAERVVDVIARMYPKADFFAMFANSEGIPPAIRGRKLTCSFLNKVPGIARNYTHLLSLHALAIESLDVSGYDLVISSDPQMVKGVITDQRSVHVCYCHSPKRSLWDQYNEYRQKMSPLTRTMFTWMSHPARSWDYLAAQRPNAMIASSEHIAQRIQKYYNRTSTVIHPPIDTHHGYIAKETGDYYFSVGRLVGYKRMDLIIEACNRLKRPLRIAGSGPEEEKLRKMAGPTIEFLGFLKGVEDPRLQQQYAGCRAFLFAADEDFGIVPLEAQSFGRPVIAYGHGGSRETVIPLHQGASRPATGVLFGEQSVDAVCEAILEFEAVEQQFSPEAIQAHARSFETEVFVTRMYELVENTFLSLNPAERAKAAFTLG